MNWNITAGRPVYVQLVEQLELALVAGEFPPGSRIPPVRELAADAGVNPNTVQRALADLERDGLVFAQRTEGRRSPGRNSPATMACVRRCVSWV